ncbi:hypothetical protein [Kamptonema sp. PCC 6506]|uniref:hypothetical protein n=1 Tax=Kamptonema sp. PCC 6506 TaxID=272129 RepID=UPI0012D74C2D|nr:hypothetical protein [Kamptonema sp. PCC 6506]
MLLADPLLRLKLSYKSAEVDFVCSRRSLRVGAIALYRSYNAIDYLIPSHIFAA